MFPLFNALAVSKRILPEPTTFPAPEESWILPPFCSRLEPAVPAMLPLFATFSPCDEPTRAYIPPLDPCAPSPVTTLMAPDADSSVEPVKISTAPLDAPSPVAMSICPLLPAVEAPLRIDTTPPVDSSEEPASISI